MRVAVEVKQIKYYSTSAIINTCYYLYKFIVYLCCSNHLWPNAIKVYLTRINHPSYAMSWSNRFNSFSPELFGIRQCIAGLQEDASQKVVGSNPKAGKGLFLKKF